MSNQATASAISMKAKPTIDGDWWRGAVIYQIYPRSFQDSDGDGVGDLQGIIDRLLYVASLGVDAIWISPFFTSPMHDFGYDIADYRNVDPLFGTISTFESLVTKAHGYGIKVLIDLVLSHTSDVHPWFIESSSSRENPKSDWYVWADAQDDGSPPNNWLSVFGGMAWEWNSVRQQYFLHNFLDSQPDLNFHNSDVQREALDVVRFWLELGVDGIRLDTVNFYFCDKELRSNPALPKGERSADIAPSVNPYNMQHHIYDKNRPENLAFLRSLRKTLNSYGACIGLGEVGDAQHGLEIMAEYTKDDSLLHSCYAFDLLSGDQITAEKVYSVISTFENKAPSGNPTWAFSNHDVVRHTTRWGLTMDAQTTVLTLLMCLRGLACLYQGEELGLSQAELTREQIQDPYGRRFWPEFKGRDGCRTPMAWDSNCPHAGFSEAVPWLPVPDSHRPLAVSAQEGDSVSMLQQYRDVIALRRQWPVLRFGELRNLKIEKTVLSFVRADASGQMFCAFNLGDETCEVAAPSMKNGTGVLGEYNPASESSPGLIIMKGWSSAAIHYK